VTGVQTCALPISQASDIESIIPISDEDNPYDVMKATIANIDGKLGIEGNVLQYNQALQLEEKYKDIQLVDIQPATEKQRLQKSPDEINKIKAAIDLIEVVITEGIKKVKLCMKVQDITEELEYLMKTYGADGP